MSPLEPTLSKICELRKPPRRRAAKRYCLAEKLRFPFKRRICARKVKRCYGNFSTWLCAQSCGAAGLRIAGKNFPSLDPQNQ
jgi:hypothetical protein